MDSKLKTWRGVTKKKDRSKNRERKWNSGLTVLVSR